MRNRFGPRTNSEDVLDCLSVGWLSWLFHVKTVSLAVFKSLSVFLLKQEFGAS